MALGGYSTLRFPQIFSTAFSERNLFGTWKSPLKPPFTSLRTTSGLCFCQLRHSWLAIPTSPGCFLAEFLLKRKVLANSRVFVFKGTAMTSWIYMDLLPTQDVVVTTRIITVVLGNPYFLLFLGVGRVDPKICGVFFKINMFRFEISGCFLRCLKFEAGAFKGCLVYKNPYFHMGSEKPFWVQETSRGLGGPCPGAGHGACPPSEWWWGRDDDDDDDDPNNIFNPCLGKTLAETKFPVLMENHGNLFIMPNKPSPRISHFFLKETMVKAGAEYRWWKKFRTSWYPPVI